MAASSEIGSDITPESNLTRFYKWRFSLVVQHQKKGEHEQGFALSQELIYDALTPPLMRVRCHLYLATSNDSPVIHAEEALKILNEIKDTTPEDVWNKAAALANKLHSEAIEYQTEREAARPDLPLLSEEKYESLSDDEGAKSSEHKPKAGVSRSATPSENQTDS